MKLSNTYHNKNMYIAKNPQNFMDVYVAQQDL